MSRFDKLILKLLRGAGDANFAFDDLRYILEKLGFDERIRGSHHIYDRDDIPELVNIQRHGKDVKVYQVDLVIHYRLAGGQDE
jgi:predicted RNA binding protein YcfA (HicA-like mRNA interferase family)